MSGIPSTVYCLVSLRAYAQNDLTRAWNHHTDLRTVRQPLLPNAPAVDQAALHCDHDGVRNCSLHRVGRQWLPLL